MAFLEEYTLLEELGQGGYATVYKVRHNTLGYVRAIRVLNAVIAHGESDTTYQNFLNECRLLLRLGNGNHPNIVHIYQPLLKSQRAIVEMDYVDGQNLTNYLTEHSSFVPVQEVINLLRDISSALAYCHEDIYKFCMDRDEDHLPTDPNNGQKVLIDEPLRQNLIRKYQVIHNDLHSANIIRRENGSYVLLDFGLAIEGETVVRSSRRKNGAPEFKSPEKWDNESCLSSQSDIYSFGVVLYEMLAGSVPFEFNKNATNSIEAEYMLCQAHRTMPPPSIYEKRKAAFESLHPGEQYQQDYPDWLEMVIMRCLQKDPRDRFFNGKELLTFVQSQLLNSEPSERIVYVEKPIYIEKPVSIDGTDDPLIDMPLSNPSSTSNSWKTLFWLLFFLNVIGLSVIAIVSTQYDFKITKKYDMFVEKQLKLDDNDSNVRKGPSMKSDPVMTLPSGTRVKVNKNDADSKWQRVYDDDGNLLGYVSRNRFEH
jgi:serine/threonine protein kinase